MWAGSGDSQDFSEGKVDNMVFRRIEAFWKSVGARQEGAVALEFALVLPVLISVLFGIIQYGLVLFTQQMMVYAAREAARSYAVGSNTAAQSVTLAQTLLPANVDSYTINVTEPDTGASETDVTVNISADMADAAIINVLGTLMSGRTIQANIVMRVESGISASGGTTTRGGSGSSGGSSS